MDQCLYGVNIPLVGAVLLEQHEDWELECRHMVADESMASIPDLEELPALLSASAEQGGRRASADQQIQDVEA